MNTQLTPEMRLLELQGLAHAKLRNYLNELEAMCPPCMSCYGKTRYEDDGWNCPNPYCNDGRLTPEGFIKELIATIQNLLNHGAHEGPCTNEGFEMDDVCDFHLEASEIRQRDAIDLLNRIPDLQE